MKLFGVVAVLAGILGMTGLPAVTPAAAAPAATAAGTLATPAAAAKSSAASRASSRRAAAKTPVRANARTRVRSSAKARSTTPAKSAKSSSKASAPRAGRAASRQALAARASAKKARARSKTQPVHTDRGAAAALASAGIGAKAVQASLHQAAPEASGTPSIGEAIGLHRVPDPLALRSAVALVVDASTGEILYEKNSHAVLPIASITKVMMAMVVLDAKQSLAERITINEADRDTERSSSSKLPMGSTLKRSELLQLALMSSENRAASALARNYPGGLSAFVAAANRKAAQIGMRDSVFMDGTGLSSSNVSTARDLAVMVAYAARYALISDYSTASDLSVRTAHGARVFRTTNRMVGSADWDLSLQKTGYISESGNCLVMRGKVDGRPMILVLLDSYGRYSRLGDAQRIRRWLEG